MHTLLPRASVLLRTKVDPMAQQPQPPRTPPVSGASRPGQPSIGELVSRICENITDLIRSELALARAKGVRMATAMSAGAAFLVVAGIMALYGRAHRRRRPAPRGGGGGRAGHKEAERCQARRAGPAGAAEG